MFLSMPLQQITYKQTQAQNSYPYLKATTISTATQYFLSL